MNAANYLNSTKKGIVRRTLEGGPAGAGAGAGGGSWEPRASTPSAAGADEDRAPAVAGGSPREPRTTGGASLPTSCRQGQARLLAAATVTAVPSGVGFWRASWTPDHGCCWWQNPCLRSSIGRCWCAYGRPGSCELETRTRIRRNRNGGRRGWKAMRRLISLYLAYSLCRFLSNS